MFSSSRCSTRFLIKVVGGHWYQDDASLVTPRVWEEGVALSTGRRGWGSLDWDVTSCFSKLNLFHYI